MGSDSQKTTNKMLEEETGRARDIGDTAETRGNKAYEGYQSDLGFVRPELHSMYSGLLEEGPGAYGGGGSSTLGFWQNLMNTGGYSEADKANILSYATGPISGLFEGLKRNLGTLSAGGRVGYGAGLSKLSRDQAYETSNAAKGVAADLAERVIANKIRGAGGVQGAEGNAGAGRRAYDNQRMQLLSAILGLEQGQDLSYMDRQLSAEGLATGTINNRVDETPTWLKMTGGLLGSAASAAGSAFGGSSTPSTFQGGAGSEWDASFDDWYGK